MTNFIEEIIDKAIINKWCIMPDCTTCGASKFKANLVIASSKKTNLDFKEKTKIDFKDKEYIATAFHHLKNDELQKIVEIIINELISLNKTALKRHFSVSEEPYEIIIDQIKMSGKENFEKLKYYSVGTPFSQFINLANNP